MSQTRSVIVRDLGRMSYEAAWDVQRQFHGELVARKLRIRDSGIDEPLQHYLLLVEHPPVYTLGKSGSLDHLLLDEAALEAGGFAFYKINRGGDITYHGPGQIVVYPIFDLEGFFTDLHRYVRCLEEAVIRTMADFGLHDGFRMTGFTGVWLPSDGVRPKRKICAIGVHLSRWVTMHGLAFNVQPDLSHFENIVPCGINDLDKDVTSMQRELGTTFELSEVKTCLIRHFSDIFEFESPFYVEGN